MGWCVDVGWKGEGESGVESFGDVDAEAVQGRLRVCRVFDPGSSCYGCITRAVGGWVEPWQDLPRRDPFRLRTRDQGDAAVVRRGGSVLELC